MLRLGLIVVTVIVVLAQGLVDSAIADLRLCIASASTASTASTVSERLAPPCCREGCPSPAMPEPAPEPADGCQCDKIPVREALVPLSIIIPTGKILADLPLIPVIALPRPACHDAATGPDRPTHLPYHRHLAFLRSVVLTC